MPFRDTHGRWASGSIAVGARFRLAAIFVAACGGPAAGLRIAGAGLAMCVAVTAGTMALASEAPDARQAQGAAELNRAFQNLMTMRDSFDTRPVDFTLNGVAYRVPRNYIVTMDNWAGGPQEIVTLQVSLPDLKPITAGTVACFDRDPADRPAGCQPLVFRLGGPPMATAAQAFSRTQVLYRNRRPVTSPDGFDMYYYGPENARVEDYRTFRQGRMVLFDCDIGDVRDRPNGTCTPIGEATESGASLSFIFAFRDFRVVVAAEPGLRKLVDGFATETKGEKP